jgi:glutamate racemase
VQQACPLLVPIIESGEFGQLENIVSDYIKKIFRKNKNIGTIILGCTHYAIIENIFYKYIPQNIEIISQGKIVAKKLKDYLERHSKIESELKKEKLRFFLTTENSSRVQRLARLFYGEKINLKIVKV